MWFKIDREREREMESSQIMRCHKSKMGSAWVNPLIDDIWDGLWHRGLQHSLRILARLRPSHYRWISLERIPPTDPAFTFKLDPRSRRCPKVWQCPGARWMVHMASARTYHRHGLVWDGNMVKNLINHGKTEVSQF